MTWVILACIVLFGASRLAMRGEGTSEAGASPSAASSASAGGSPAVSTAATPQWETSSSVDKMTSKREVYATSPTTGPTEAMSSPYRGVTSWIGVGCNGPSEWAYIGFSTAPNLVNTDIADGYSRIRTRIKWDNTISQETLTQKWGDAFLHFPNSVRAITKIGAAKSVLLELDWYGERTVYFQFPMDGVADAIRSMRKQCGK
jgi:hypothetical protein